jgi:UDP-N-acetylmuramate: L-alanyl-gamma-D-glutamyl-meso-diaminopimelate ligase
LVRTIPSEGLVIHPTTEPALQRVIEMGCWTPVQTTGAGGQWQVKLLRTMARRSKCCSKVSPKAPLNGN